MPVHYEINTANSSPRIFFSYSSSSQTKYQEGLGKLHPDFALINHPPRSVAVDKDYKISEATNVYELALNFSYFLYYNSGSVSEYLTLPVIIIGEMPADYTKLKNIQIEEIETYSFEYGLHIAAIYGSSGLSGLIKIKLKNDKTND